jgi:capsular polysaccharide biosynthesis protein
MDLFAALVALGRRWYLTLALLVVLLAGTYVAASATKPEYKAEASVIVLAPVGDPKNPTNQGISNPFVNAGEAVFANVLSRVMAADTTKQQIVKGGGTATYTVGQGTSANGPIINIEATSASPTVATRTAALLISAINHEAQRQQVARGVATDAFITTSTVTAGDKPSKLQGSRTRVTVAVGAMGGVLTFAAVLLIDNFLIARRTRKRRGQGDDEDVAGSAGPGSRGPAAGGSSGGQELPLARVRR